MAKVHTCVPNAYCMKGPAVRPGQLLTQMGSAQKTNTLYEIHCSLYWCPKGPALARLLKKNLSCQISFCPNEELLLLGQAGSRQWQRHQDSISLPSPNIVVQVIVLPVAVLTHWFILMTALVVRSLWPPVLPPSLFADQSSYTSLLGVLSSALGLCNCTSASRHFSGLTPRIQFSLEYYNPRKVFPDNLIK